MIAAIFARKSTRRGSEFLVPVPQTVMFTAALAHAVPLAHPDRRVNLNGEPDDRGHMTVPAREVSGVPHGGCGNRTPTCQPAAGSRRDFTGRRRSETTVPVVAHTQHRPSSSISSARTPPMVARAAFTLAGGIAALSAIHARHNGRSTIAAVTTATRSGMAGTVCRRGRGIRPALFADAGRKRLQSSPGEPARAAPLRHTGRRPRGVAWTPLLARPHRARP
jgi:hypothetical protein